MRELKKALVAMSGGVDSSVAAYLVKQQGMQAIGCTMRLYENEDIGIHSESVCCTTQDIEDARTVAAKLGMDYCVCNFRNDFKEKIIGKFVHCYECGITPNPCIDCNRYMKFNMLHEKAKELDCDYVVTGHYARIEWNSEQQKYVLKKALDPAKDQSYVLYMITQEQLAHTLYPLGGMNKEDARKIAEKVGLVNAQKPDSQDICFVPDGDYAVVIAQYTAKPFVPGPFVSVEGKVLGQHRGIAHYTIGQRRGLGVSAPEPLYVKEICPENNTVVLATNTELFSREVCVDEMHWISGEEPSEPFRCLAKIRYRHREQPALVTPMKDGKIKILFDEPQRAITPGQSAVLYDGEIVLGGGVIVR